MKYAEAKKMFETCRNKEAGKPLENNTRLVKTAKGYGIKLHRTVVVEILPNNTYILKNGGWQTVTTKDRINTYSPAIICQKNNIWYVGGFDKKHYIFQENMIVDAKGIPVNAKKLDQQQDKLRSQNDQLTKMIRKYINGFCQLIKDKKLEDPSAGDCWICCGMLGDNDDVTHLIDHMNEDYYVPRLLWNAIEENGYSNPYYAWMSMKRGSAWAARSSLRAYFKKRRVSLYNHLFEQKEHSETKLNKDGESVFAY